VKESRDLARLRVWAASRRAEIHEAGRLVNPQAGTPAPHHFRKRNSFAEVPITARGFASCPNTGIECVCQSVTGPTRLGGFTFMTSNAAKVLAAVCVLLVIFLAVIKRGDNQQHAQDTRSIAEFSNTLNAAQAVITNRDFTILTLSNRLGECESASTSISNKLTAAIAAGEEKITGLTQKISDLSAENQERTKHIANLTNEIAALNNKLAEKAAMLTRTNEDLAQLQKEYRLLDNRLRRDIAERIVVERRLNNPQELKAQLVYLKTNPPAAVTADEILLGLDVEVKSNGTYHVLAPD
jgi:flagellar motility protein MotE (MotC chaperone)